MCPPQTRLLGIPLTPAHLPFKECCDESSTDGGPDDCTSAELSSVDEASDPISSSCSLELLPSHSLHNCKVVRLLGTGATCRVDLVLVPSPGALTSVGPEAGSGRLQAAARKVMPRSRDPHLRAREDALFAREVEGLRAGLGCPFVVQLLAIATYHDRQELLMELAEGDTLEQELSDALSAVRGELRRPLLAPARIAEVAASVLAALAALHEQGFAHLDVKPANLLRTAEGRIMLGDAGCMQRVSPDDGLLHGPASGTPLFAAPEVKCKAHGQGQGQTALSVKADMYSVGVLLVVCAAWHRMTGRVLAFLRGQVGLPEYVPDGLRDLVSRLVAADPEQRLSAAEALEHPFLAGVDLRALAPRRFKIGVPR